MSERLPKKFLKRVIEEMILSEPSTVMKYTGGRCKTPCGKFEKRLRARLQQHALTKMLTLVAFLDLAKERHLLADDPCLFEKSATVKSSLQVLVSICQDCFARDECIAKHSYLGISVSHVQNPLDEYEFFIENLAVDLKDGVRLAKMVEILTMTKNVLTEMRLPAVSRDHKIHNVGIVLSALHNAGVGNISDVTAAHIVDAHQPRILQLLWSIIVEFQIAAVLDASAICKEIDRLSQLKTRENNNVKDSLGLEQLDLTGGTYERIKRLLLVWCQVVCSFHGVSVENFSTSFADGKVLCLLISFYLPSILPLQAIRPTVSDLQITTKMGVKIAGYVHKKGNLALAMARMSEVGGIPPLFSASDFLLPPEEKAIILCLSFLFSRLTVTQQEFVATVSIQTWFRRCRQRSIFKKKRSAASFILEQWRRNKEKYFHNQTSRYSASIRAIESFVLTHQDRLEHVRSQRIKREKRVASIIRIQASLIFCLLLFNM